jgi:hypothetical protein
LSPTDAGQVNPYFYWYRRGRIGAVLMILGLVVMLLGAVTVASSASSGFLIAGTGAMTVFLAGWVGGRPVGIGMVGWLSMLAVGVAFIAFASWMLR